MYRTEHNAGAVGIGFIVSKNQEKHRKSMTIRTKFSKGNSRSPNIYTGSYSGQWESGSLYRRTKKSIEKL